MTVNLTPEQEAKLLADYHTRKTEREAIDQQLKKEQETRNAFYQELHNKQNQPHKLRKPQICEKCGLTINAKEMAVSRSVKVGFGFPEGYHRVTYYRHSGECPSRV